jgi:hypothetical protein
MQGQPYDWFNLEDMGALIQSEEFASTLKEAFCVVVFIPKLINLQRQTHPCCFFLGRRIFAGGKNTFTIFENPPEIHFPDPWSSVFQQIPQGKIQCSPQGTML